MDPLSPLSVTYRSHQTLGITASDTLDIIVHERIGEVNVKDIFSQKIMETEWHISDNHRQTLSFSDVHPAHITVRNLEVGVDTATSLVDTFKAKFAKPRVDDVEGGVVGGVQRKRILKDISANFPAGTLTAIVGGSGSGKVYLRLRDTLRST